MDTTSAGRCARRFKLRIFCEYLCICTSLNFCSGELPSSLRDLTDTIVSDCALCISCALSAGDGPEERMCAEARGWSFIQVCLSTDGQDKAEGRRLTDITAKNVLSTANQ